LVTKLGYPYLAKWHGFGLLPSAFVELRFFQNRFQLTSP